MAEREDIRKRNTPVNPAFEAAEAEIEGALAKQGLTCLTKLTDDMTPEEQEMELYAGYLKEGYSEDISAEKAKETLALIDRVFGKNKAEDIKKRS